MSGTRYVTAALATVVLGIALTGCGASTNLVRPCCYSGDVAVTHLVDTRLVLEDGTTADFRDVFPGFNADPSPIGRVFPFPKADIGLVTFASLRDILPKYDANENRILEEPETDRPLRSGGGARGLGYPVVGIEPSGRNGAIATSRADVSALVRFVERRRHEMARPQQRIFRDLYWLGLEVDLLPHFYDDEVGGLGI